MNTLLKVSIILCMVALSCDLFALAAPKWFNNSKGKSLGLFEMCEGKKCSSIIALQSSTGQIARAVAALMIISVLKMILGFCLILCACSRNDVRLTKLSSIVILIAGICALSAVSTFSFAILLSQEDAMSVMYLQKEVKITYTLGLTLAGALLAIASGVIGLLSLHEHYNCCERRMMFNEFKISSSSKQGKPSSIRSANNPLLDS